MNIERLKGDMRVQEMRNRNEIESTYKLQKQVVNQMEVQKINHSSLENKRVDLNK